MLAFKRYRVNAAFYLLLTLHQHCFRTLQSTLIYHTYKTLPGHKNVYHTFQKCMQKHTTWSLLALFQWHWERSNYAKTSVKNKVSD